jgi:hypothetical protein
MKIDGIEQKPDRVVTVWREIIGMIIEHNLSIGEIAALVSLMSELTVSEIRAHHGGLN